jgi:tetratricopeptide (TPR) repeat protein
MKTKPANSKRILLLALILVASVLALVITRSRMQPPPEPPKTASVSDKRKLYEKRIKDDPSDVRAYVELGKLEESQEFYISALRRLTIARALGAPEKDIILPIGRALTHLARWDEARAELTKAVQIMPDSVEAAANLSGVYFSSGSAGEASKVMQEFVARRRAADHTLNLPVNDLRRIMGCFSEARDNAMAAEIAKEIIRIEPNDPGAYAIAGHALLLDEHYKEALPYFEKAASLAPSESSLSYNYGVALEHTGREAEAMKQFQKCVILNPGATDGFVELANLYEKRKDWKLAAVALSNAAQHSKTNYILLYRAAKLNEKAGNLPEANYWYSNGALAAGKYPEALGFATKLAQSSDPTWRASGLVNIAEAYRGMHKMKEYLEAVKKSATGDTAQDYLRLADGYQKADFLDKQVEYLRRALEKEPKLAAVVHYTIAQTMLKRGLREEAEKELALAIEADPQNPEYHDQLGGVYFERRLNGDRLKKAIAEYQQAIRLDPQESTGFQHLGIALSAAGDYGRAAFYLEHAIDLQPGYGPSYQELGRVYVKMGDKASGEKTLALYNKYVRYDLRLKTLTAKADQNKNNPAAQVELADLLARTGDFAGALQRYEMALQLKPGQKETQRKYDRVLEILSQKKRPQTH